jgi:plasmid stability protein
MPQLLVRNVNESLVRKLKRRALLHGVSAEEEHRRILKETLSAQRTKKRTLMDFLLSDDAAVHPEVELDLSRSRDIETHREIVL